MAIELVGEFSIFLLYDTVVFSNATFMRKQSTYYWRYNQNYSSQPHFQQRDRPGSKPVGHREIQFVLNLPCLKTLNYPEH